MKTIQRWEKIIVNHVLLRHFYLEHIQNSDNSIMQRQVTQGLEKVFLQRRYTNDQQAHKKIPNIISHRGNASQNPNLRLLPIS